jgi:hypothetical protein
MMWNIFEFRSSSFISPRSKGLLLVAALAVMLTLPISARAQGCAMCANNAAAVRAGAIKSLQNGILILLVPVVLMSGGFAVLAYRSRNRFHGRDYESDGRWDDELPPNLSPPPDSLREADFEVYEESESPVGASV